MAQSGALPRAITATRTRSIVGRSLDGYWRVADGLLDVVCLIGGFWLAYLLRYRFEVGGDVQVADYEPFGTFQRAALVFAAMAMLSLVMRGTYRLPRWTGFLDEASLVMGAVTTAMGALVLFAFLLRFSPSRLLFVYAWGMALALLLARRIASRSAWRWAWARGMGVDHVLVVGAGESARRLMQAVMNHPGLGYRVVGFVDDEGGSESVGVATERGVVPIERLGTTAEVAEIVAARRVDEVIIALPGAAQQDALRIIDQCRRTAVGFKVVPDLLQLSLDRVDIGEVAGMPLIGLKDASIRGANYAVKRGADIAIALVVLLAMVAPMLVIAAAIRLDSRGSVLFRQTRIGRNGRPFTLTKFRCMVDDAEAQRESLLAAHIGDGDPRLFKLRDDPRLTRAGRILRRWSLDEAPQFAQVLAGTMSIVGPRPQLPDEVAQYEPWHRQRLLVTPGLTGLWQVNGRSDLSFDEMVRLDLYYAERWSLWLDIKIVLRTIPAVLTGRGAY